MLEIILSAIFVRRAWNSFLILFLFCFSIFSQKVWATPGKVEVWFLSETTAKASWHKDDGQLFYQLHFSEKLAENSYVANCIPMGDGCFNPQYGFIENDKNKIPSSKSNDKEGSTKTINSLETEVINCDKNFYFDLYCGKALKGVVQKEGVEVWIDNSGSFKAIDVPKSGDYCYRRTFAEKLRDDCDGKVAFSVFNTSIKPISDLSVICDNVGGNDTMRLIRWISGSEARELIIITDFSEYNDKLEVYLNSIGAQIKGIGTKPLLAHELDNYLGELKNKCVAKNK